MKLKKALFILRARDRYVQKLQEEIEKGKTPYAKFNNNMLDTYTDYSLTNAKKVQDKVLKSLKGTAEVTDSAIKKALKIVEDQYNTGLLTIRKELTKYTPPLYEYRKSKWKVKKADDPEYTNNITGIDKETIKLLVDTDMVWVLEHTTQTQISRDIAREMKLAKDQGLTVQEVAEKMQEKFSKLTGDKYNKRYSEKSYWQSTVQTQTQRIKAYANINDMEYAGYDIYKWFTRGSDVCPICIPMDGKTFKVSDARKNIDKYFEAGAKEDIEGMKKADKWLDINDVKANPNGIPGQLPQLHGNCYCEIRPE